MVFKSFLANTQIVIFSILVLCLCLYLIGNRIRRFFSKKVNKERTLIPGMQAPDFTLLDETKTPRKLSDFLGKRIVLYFYPKDNTPTCVKEACQLRDAYTLLFNNNITILGVNYDSPESHAYFKSKYHLPFSLLSDSSKTVSKKYNAYSSFLRMFPRRKTVLINEQGLIIKIIDTVDLNSHVHSILESFTEPKEHDY
jgi:peroxiredoxin Q/BCP